MQVEPGQKVEVNEAVALIEAMKMESIISAPIAGTVERPGGASVRSVEPGDLVLVIVPRVSCKRRAPETAWSASDVVCPRQRGGSPRRASGRNYAETKV